MRVVDQVEAVRLLEARGIAVDGRLSPCDLELAAGDRLAVVAPSGGGKTTLLRCLALLESSAEGNVLFRGAAIEDVPAFRRRVIYAHQRPAVSPSQTVEEAFDAVYRVGIANGALQRDRADHWLERLGLSPSKVWMKPMSTLSEGELSRVHLARLLLLEPDVLLLDEPTAALDPDTTRMAEQAWSEWLEAKPEERAFVLVSHDESQRDRCCSRELRLEPVESSRDARGSS